jgi:hypothetical protein
MCDVRWICWGVQHMPSSCEAPALFPFCFNFAIFQGSAALLFDEVEMVKPSTAEAVEK